MGQLTQRWQRPGLETSIGDHERRIVILERKPSSSGSTGIQFDTDPQSGLFLTVTTTSGNLDLIQESDSNAINIYASGAASDILIESVNAKIQMAAGSQFDIDSGGALNMTADGVEVDAGSYFIFSASTFGAFGSIPVAKPTGVAVTAAAIHAALVDLGWIAP
jgi:hypothetical protein